jgi:hypothetical protein
MGVGISVVDPGVEPGPFVGTGVTIAATRRATAATQKSNPPPEDEDPGPIGGLPPYSSQDMMLGFQ